MNLEIKDEWITALLSGEYPQSQYWLRSYHGYCCWGVLCEIAVKHSKMEFIPASGPSMYAGAYRWIDDVTGHSVVRYPPKQLIVWAEIDMEAIPKQNTIYYFGNVNDNGSNFPYIANEIRENL